MIILVIIFPKKDNTNKIQIFNPYFVQKNKNKYKIIYKNKVLQLKSEFLIKDKKISKLKIELICLADIFLNYDLIKGIRPFIAIYPSKISKRNLYKFKNWQFISYVNWSIIEYNAKPQISYNFNIFNIDFNNLMSRPKIEKIKVFGEIFVKNNRDKCLILYRNVLFPLKEYFPMKIIGNKEILEFDLIELSIITDKSYMFHNCDLLINFPLLEVDVNNDNSKKLKESKNIQNYYLNPSINMLKKENN